MERVGLRAHRRSKYARVSCSDKANIDLRQSTTVYFVQVCCIRFRRKERWVGTNKGETGYEEGDMSRKIQQENQ